MPTRAGPSPQEHMLGLAPSSGLPCPYLIGQESSLNEVPQPPGVAQACASNSAPVTLYVTAPFSPPMWRTATGPMTDKELAVGSRPGLVTL